MLAEDLLPWRMTGIASGPPSTHSTIAYLPGKNSSAVFFPTTAQLAPSETVPSRPKTLPCVLSVTSSSLIIQLADSFNQFHLLPVVLALYPLTLPHSFSHEALGERVVNKRGLYSELADLP